MTTIHDAGNANKTVAHYIQKMELRKAKRTGILDLGATPGAAPEEDMINL
jgi:hypothetical protein